MSETQPPSEGALPAIPPRVPMAPWVLLAEDDQAMQRVLAEQLERRGYDAMIAEDGLHLVTQIESHLGDADWTPPLAIICDVRMPGIDGLRALRWLQQRSQIPVVIITAFGTEELHAEASRLGAAAVLDKPFRFEQLATVLHSLSRVAAEEVEPRETSRASGGYQPAMTYSEIRDNSPATTPQMPQPGASSPDRTRTGATRPGDPPDPMRGGRF